MKKYALIALVLALAGIVAQAQTATTETYTNAFGDVFTVVTGVVGTGDKAEVVTVASNDEVTPGRGVMYLTSAAAATNVTFAQSFTPGEFLTLINVGTNAITLVDSAADGLELSSDTALGELDTIQVFAISEDLAVETAQADN
jgi:hypothetical protein